MSRKTFVETNASIRCQVFKFKDMLKILSVCLFLVLGMMTVKGEKIVRVVWLIPSDVEYEEEVEKAMARAIRIVRSFYAEQLNGKTFRLNDPVVEICKGDHPRRWYTEHAVSDEPDTNYNALENALAETARKLGRKDLDDKYRWVIYISAKGEGAATCNATVLTQHDIDGLVDRGTRDLQRGCLRWWGGLAHELGHTFAIPDIYQENAGSIMGDAGFFTFPNNVFSDWEREVLADEEKNGGLLQEVKLPFEEGSIYVIRNLQNGKVLARNEGDRGRSVVCETYEAKPCQQWKLHRMPNGFYHISSVEAGETSALLVPGSRAARPELVKCSHYYDKDTHKWCILGCDSGFVICSAGSLNFISCNEQGEVQHVRSSVGPECLFHIEKIQ